MFYRVGILVFCSNAYMFKFCTEGDVVVRYFTMTPAALRGY